MIPAPIPFNQKPLLQEQQQYIVWLEAEVARLRREAQAYKDQLEALRSEQRREQDEQLLEDLQKEADALAAKDAKNKEFAEWAFPMLAAAEEQKPRRKNMLYNLDVIIRIPGIEQFKVRAILDTGATLSVIREDAVPPQALEENSYTVSFSGINSTQTTRMRLKNGTMEIGGSIFRIPYVYSFPFKLGEDIQFILGNNFIRAMHGGIRIEGDTVTIYKNVTSIQTKQTVSILRGEIEDDFNYEVYQYLGAIESMDEAMNKRFINKFTALINRLKDQGYIGEDPLKHWVKNQVKCKLDIKNPDMIIEDEPLKHVTQYEELLYQDLTDMVRKTVENIKQLGEIQRTKLHYFINHATSDNWYSDCLSHVRGQVQATDIALRAAEHMEGCSENLIRVIKDLPL